MRLLIEAGEPVEEIAAEPATLQRFGALLDRARDLPAIEGRLLSGGPGLLALPRIPDPTLPPLVVELRPHTTQEH